MMPVAGKNSKSLSTPGIKNKIVVKFLIPHSGSEAHLM
jgi:hypothetical protein